MKTKLALFFAVLAAYAAPVQADFTESNISITLKFYFNAEEETVKGDKESLNYTTATLKNADIIAAYNEAYEDTLALNSRIIRRDEFDAEGEFLDFQILIRDKTQGDIDITDLVDFSSSETDAVKYSYSASKGTGTYSAIYERSIEILVDPEDEESQEIDAAGLERLNIKTVIVKSTQNFVDLAAVNTSLNGYAYFYNEKADGVFNGIVEGSYKETGAKVVVLDDE